MESLPSRGSWAAIGIVWLVCSSSCSSSTVDEDQVIVDEARRTYRSTLSEARPDYVVITYPDTVWDLPTAKRVEYETLCKVLDELRIPYDGKKYSDVLTTFRGKSSEERKSFHLSREIAARCEGGMVWYIHLDRKERVRTFVHPNCREFRVKVQLAYDPLALHSGS